ncbi:hypothetical protein GCM10007276_00430 [Agaricicola taiwanensis]|uniref:DUF924 domain-containing protein n=1 Tax=Agaricicola taiwanensis TaxID=591372 RepID=A0A8J2VJT3_9RHOB|nr:DUF924 family protein [Agaricicola taiwanensis]GGE27195.1 hypothetical protein GCM10007276_00430 [Agaricicola taiwanensis]
MFDPRAVVAFWRAAGPSRWFLSDPLFDMLVRWRLGPVHQAAARGELQDWLRGPIEALALTIVLDQVPRNIYRGTPRAFATDGLARHASDVVRAMGWDRRVPRALRAFFYLPLEHSEDLADQELCCALFQAMKDADGLRWAEIHRDIIARFGRFPHRNEILGRTTTAEEARFLAEGGFRG